MSSLLIVTISRTWSNSAPSFTFHKAAPIHTRDEPDGWLLKACAFTWLTDIKSFSFYFGDILQLVGNIRSNPLDIHPFIEVRWILTPHLGRGVLI
jgi:hypothetical protein